MMRSDMELGGSARNSKGLHDAVNPHKFEVWASRSCYANGVLGAGKHGTRPRSAQCSGPQRFEVAHSHATGSGTAHDKGSRDAEGRCEAWTATASTGCEAIAIGSDSSDQRTQGNERSKDMSLAWLQKVPERTLAGLMPHRTVKAEHDEELLGDFSRTRTRAWRPASTLACAGHAAMQQTTTHEEACHGHSQPVASLVDGAWGSLPACPPTTEKVLRRVSLSVRRRKLQLDDV